MHMRGVWDEPVRRYDCIQRLTSQPPGFPCGWVMPGASSAAAVPKGRGRRSKRIAASDRRYDPTVTAAGPGWVRRFRDWYRRWITFLREPPEGPFWHEHHDR